MSGDDIFLLIDIEKKRDGMASKEMANSVLLRNGCSKSQSLDHRDTAPLSSNSLLNALCTLWHWHWHQGLEPTAWMTPTSSRSQTARASNM